MAQLIDLLRKDLASSFSGDIENSASTLRTYSTDASLFEVQPELVVFPRSSNDVQALVAWVASHKKDSPTLSLTARAAGTDMSGGPLNTSIIVDLSRYMNKMVELTDDYAVVEPGMLYRDFDKMTRARGRFMPAYTASREICAVGGMVANNSGGEKSIKYGKVENYNEELSVVFSDGKEYTVKPLSEDELKAKIEHGESGTEREVYKQMYELILQNYELVMGAKPDVSKNSSGYYLWNVYDKEQKTFDLCRLICGSQGTLGIVTKIKWKLVPVPAYSNVLVVFLPSLDHVSDLVTEILPFKPESLETYDDYSMILAVKFFFDFFKQMGFWGAVRLGFQFVPETLMMLSGGIPKLVLIVECTGASKEEVNPQLEEIESHIKKFGFHTRITKSADEAEKYWRIRHESFNLLRKHTKGKRTAPFIDDIVVKPEFLPDFLPRVRAILDEYKLDYTIQGHLGNGNFHIIPLMNLSSPFSADKILEISKKVYALVEEFHGSNSAEHNDGIIRTPFLRDQFGDSIVSLFEKTKQIFDPQNIFNPGKKVGGTFDDIKKWIMKKN